MNALHNQPEQPRAQRGPVFVDASGRRLRLARLSGLAALGLVAAYVVLLLVAFIGGSNVPAPYLPLPAAAGQQELPPAPPAPPSGADLHHSDAPAPAAPAVANAPATAAAPAALPGTPPSDSTPVQPALPAAPAVPEAAADPAAPGMSGTDPGMSGSAPGQATRPSAPAHP